MINFILVRKNVQKRTSMTLCDIGNMYHRGAGMSDFSQRENRFLKISVVRPIVQVCLQVVGRLDDQFSVVIFQFWSKLFYYWQGWNFSLQLAAKHWQFLVCLKLKKKLPMFGRRSGQDFSRNFWQKLQFLKVSRSYECFITLPLFTVVI